jgi:hypothetical protein
MIAAYKSYSIIVLELNKSFSQVLYNYFREDGKTYRSNLLLNFAVAEFVEATVPNFIIIKIHFQ